MTLQRCDLPAEAAAAKCMVQQLSRPGAGAEHRRLPRVHPAMQSATVSGPAVLLFPAMHSRSFHQQHLQQRCRNQSMPASQCGDTSHTPPPSVRGGVVQQEALNSLVEEQPASWPGFQACLLQRVCRRPAILHASPEATEGGGYQNDSPPTTLPNQACAVRKAQKGLDQAHTSWASDGTKRLPPPAGSATAGSARIICGADSTSAATPWACSAAARTSSAAVPFGLSASSMLPFACGTVGHCDHSAMMLAHWHMHKQACDQQDQSVTCHCTASE